METLPADWRIRIKDIDMLNYYPLEDKNDSFTVQAVIDMRTYDDGVVQTTPEGIAYAPLRRMTVRCGAVFSNPTSSISILTAIETGMIIAIQQVGTAMIWTLRSIRGLLMIPTTASTRTVTLQRRLLR